MKKLGTSWCFRFGTGPFKTMTHRPPPCGQKDEQQVHRFSWIDMLFLLIAPCTENLPLPPHTVRPRPTSSCCLSLARSPSPSIAASASSAFTLVPCTTTRLGGSRGYTGRWWWRMCWMVEYVGICLGHLRPYSAGICWCHCWCPILVYAGAVKMVRNVLQEPGPDFSVLRCFPMFLSGRPNPNLLGCRVCSGRHVESH